MKKSTKSLLSLVMAIIMLFGCATTSLAAFDVEFPVIGDVFTSALSSVTDTKEEYQSRQAKAGDEYVATLSVCASVYSHVFSGHSWIYVHNLSDEPIKVGYYTVPVGEGVSVGVFSFSVSEGWGLYYNLEAYRDNLHNREDIIWSKTKYLTASELKSVSNDIANYNNYWDFYFNCAHFAYKIWNNATGSNFVSLLLPIITQAQIKNAGGQKGVLDMFTPTRDQVLRQKGNGASATFVPVSDKTLNN